MSFLSDAQIVAQALDDYYQRSKSGAGSAIEQAPMGDLIADLELAHATVWNQICAAQHRLKAEIRAIYNRA